ncbi:hypothetical protein ACFL1H_01810 [Nanoarchaeota archaeon]
MAQTNKSLVIVMLVLLIITAGVIVALLVDALGQNNVEEDDVGYFIEPMDTEEVKDDLEYMPQYSYEDIDDMDLVSSEVTSEEKAEVSRVFDNQRKAMMTEDKELYLSDISSRFDTTMTEVVMDDLFAYSTYLDMKFNVLSYEKFGTDVKVKVTTTLTFKRDYEDKIYTSISDQLWTFVWENGQLKVLETLALNMKVI